MVMNIHDLDLLKEFRQHITTANLPRTSSLYVKADGSFSVYVYKDRQLCAIANGNTISECIKEAAYLLDR